MDMDGPGPVKIAAALAIAAAVWARFAYKKFRTYLSEKKLRKERRTKSDIRFAQRRLKSDRARAKNRNEVKQNR